MDFDPKTSELRNQEAMDKYRAGYGFCWSPRIKIEFGPDDVDVSSVPPDKEGVYMHPLVVALGLRLPMTKFVCNVSSFYGVVSSQIPAVGWCTVLEFEALCDIYAPEACHCEVFSAAYLLKKTTLGACYFILPTAVEKIVVNMVDSNRGMRDTVVQVSGPWDDDLEEERRLSLIHI